MDAIKLIITIPIILIVLALLLSFFNVSLTIGQTSNFYRFDFSNLFDEMIKWLEEHISTVTALGIISTILIFVTEKYLEKRKQLFDVLKNNISYYNAIINEINTLNAFIQSTKKLKEGKYEIYNFVFPTEVYEKLSIDKVEPISEFSKNIIIDFYTNVKARNRLYIHRMEVKHRFIRTTNDQGWIQFIEYFDKQINDYEIALSKIIQKVIEVIEGELEENGKVEQSEERFIITRSWLKFQKSFLKLINK